MLFLLALSARAELPWWETAHVFGQAPFPSTLNESESVHAWGSNAETPEQTATMVRSIEATHGENHRYVGTVSAFNPSHDALELNHELYDARVINIDGEFSVIDWKSNNDVTTWFLNTNEPVYQAYLKDQVENLIDSGVDGILIDEIEGTAGTTNRGGSFGDRDMALFNDYLLTLYTPEQLEQYWGIDIETFNYGDYIRNRGSAEAYRENPFSIPLFEHYRDFQRIAVRDFMEELIAHGKNYAQTTYGKDIAFTANIYGWHSHQILFGDLLDYFTVEYGYREDGYAPENHALPYMLYGNSRGKRSVLLPGTFTGNEIHAWDNADIGSLWLMESYVTGNTFLHSRNWFGGTSNVDGAFVEFSLNYEGNTRLLEFVADNDYLYKGEPYARVGVLYSYASDYINYIRDAWGGVAFALLDAHVQFDVMSLGDDVFLEDTFTEQDLSAYEVLVIPWSRNMSLEHLEKLLSFAEDGGTLIIIDPDTGSRDQKNGLIERPEWNSVTTEGSRSYGSGEIHVLPAGWGLEYFETRDPSMRADILEPLPNLWLRGTAADAPETLHLAARYEAGAPLMTVHALNYDFDKDTQKITPSGAFELQVLLPDPLVDHPDLAVYQIQPGGAAKRLDPWMSFDGKKIGCMVESVDIYSSIVVTTNAKAKELTDPVLEDLDAYLDSLGDEADGVAGTADTLHAIDQAYADGDYLVARSKAHHLERRLERALRKRVLFVEGNGAVSFLDYERAELRSPDNPAQAHLGRVAGMLSDDFVLESTEDPLTGEMLNDYDVVVLNSPWFWFESEELDALHGFVDGGGGLLVLGNPQLNGALTLVTEPYGIFVHGEVLSRDDADTFGVFRVESNEAHPAFPSDLPFTLSWSTRLSVSAPAQTLVSTGAGTWMDELEQNQQHDEGERYGDFAMAAVYADGESRVFVLGDSPFHDTLLPRTRNDLVLRSALHWLAGDDTGSNGGDSDGGDNGEIPAEQVAYWDWIDGYYPGASYGTPGAEWSPGSDPDGDGMNNLMEFILERDPTFSDPADFEPKFTTRPDGTVTATFTFEGRSEAAFQWLVAESSADSADWNRTEPTSSYWNGGKNLLRLKYALDAETPAEHFRFFAEFDSDDSGGGDDPAGSPEQDAYWNWIRGYYPNAAPGGGDAAGSPGGDPDGDGLNNLMEFILEHNPTVSDPASFEPIYSTRPDGTQTVAFVFEGRSEAAFEWLRGEQSVDNAHWEDIEPHSVYWNPDKNVLRLKYPVDPDTPAQYFRFTAAFSSDGSDGSGGSSIPPEQEAYWAWIGNYYPGAEPGDASADGSPTADPDGDGLNNLMEFMLENNPTGADPEHFGPVYSARPDGTQTATFLLEGRSEAVFQDWLIAQSRGEGSSWTDIEPTSSYWNPDKNLLRLKFAVDDDSPAQDYRFIAAF